MKTPSNFITLFLIFIIHGVLFSKVNSQSSSSSSSCSSKLDQLKTQLPFDTSSLTCNSVWAPHGFTLRYGKSEEPNAWSFVVSAPNPNGYIAIGFSPNGRMVGSSAIAGWVGPNSVPTMKSYFLGGETPTEVVADQGNLRLRNSTIIVGDNSDIHMFFQLLGADKPEFRVIYAVGPNGIFPSGPNFRLMEHRDMVSTSLDYTTGESETKKDPNTRTRRSHGILSMLSWGIMMPIGMMSARYLRKYEPLWFYTHTILQSVSFILGVAAVICGFVLNNRLGNNVDRHKGIGITILAFACLQVMAFLARPRKEAKVRRYWNWYHHTVGRVMVVLAIINIFYGIHLANAGKGWVVVYALVLVVFFFSVVVFELRLWKMTRTTMPITK